MREAQLALPPPSGGSSALARVEEPKYGLQPSKGSVQRVPHGEVFPMRPPELGPGDQLILNAISDEEQLTMAQIFELFARNREDPEYWTAARLADEYFTREEWVTALLQYMMPPTFVKFEGDFYGVYEVVGGPEDTEAARAAKRLQLRANQAREAEQIEAARLERRRLAEEEKQKYLRRLASDVGTAGPGQPSWDRRPPEDESPLSSNDDPASDERTRR